MKKSREFWVDPNFNKNNDAFHCREGEPEKELQYIKTIKALCEQGAKLESLCAELAASLIDAQIFLNHEGQDVSDRGKEALAKYLESIGSSKE